jgi:hypothetical protein
MQRNPQEFTGQPVPRREDAVCEECGRYGAFEFDTRTLCADCYAVCGSCCPEFGASAKNFERDDAQ